MTRNKICTKCGRAFPATPQYFHYVGRNKYGDRLRGECKGCVNRRVSERYHALHPEATQTRGRPRKKTEKPQPKAKRHKATMASPNEVVKPDLLIIDCAAGVYRVCKLVKEVPIAHEATIPQMRGLYESMGYTIVTTEAERE